MFLPGIKTGPKKTTRSRCTRKNAAHRAKNARRRRQLQK